MRNTDKKGNSKDKNKNKSKNKKPEKYSQEEMNAMVSEAIKDLVKTKRKKTPDANRTCKELNLMESLTVSSSDNDQKDDIISVQSFDSEVTP